MSHRIIKSGDVFRHYKGPHYKVINISTHTETGESLVIYHNIKNLDITWARPLEMFNEYVNYNDTIQLRFDSILHQK